MVCYTAVVVTSRNDPPHKPVSGEKLCVTTQRVALLQTSEQVMKSLRMSVFPPIQRKKEAHDRELFVLFLCKSCIDEHHQFKALSLTPKFQERLNDRVVTRYMGSGITVPGSGS